jgi:RNA polymerase sigma factor (sigma-70 family)
MRETGDIELLRQYAREGSEEAFEKLMAGHVDLVYSAALRKTGNPHAAEEITQAVFIILAQKSDKLRRGTILSGWLYQTARLTAANYLRTEIRRYHREQETCLQSLDNETGPEVWPHMAPLLEDAMGRLGGKDRDAIVLRFMEGKDFREVGAAFGASENAAKKRVGRALEKLRKFFAKRGVVSTTAVIAGSISANSVQAVPAGLAKSISAVAIAKGAAASGSTLTLVKGALKLMAWTKAQTAVVAGTAILLAVGTTSLTVKEIQENRTYPWQLARSGRDLEMLLANATPQVRILHSTSRSFGWVSTRSTNMGPPFKPASPSDPGGKILGLGLDFKLMIQAAYAPTYNTRHLWKITSTANLPGGRYDIIASLPEGSPYALQQEIARKFGLVAELKTLDTNVLLLRVKYPNSPGLVPGATYAWKTNMAFFCGCLENDFQMPVLDRTGDYDLEGVPAEFRKVMTPEQAKQAPIDHLGLELVPSHEPVEMLVIEKAP